MTRMITNVIDTENGGAAGVEVDPEKDHTIVMIVVKDLTVGIEVVGDGGHRAVGHEIDIIDDDQDPGPRTGADRMAATSVIGTGKSHRKNCQSILSLEIFTEERFRRSFSLDALSRSKAYERDAKDWCMCLN